MVFQSNPIKNPAAETFCRSLADSFVAGAKAGKDKTPLRLALNNALKNKIESERLKRWEGIVLADRIMSLVREAGCTMM